MKNSYQTRRLLALRDMRHDGQNVIAGGEVFATETDANYLIRGGHARPVDEPTKESPKIAGPAPTTVARRGPGRPPKAESAALAPTPPRAPAPTVSAVDVSGDAPSGAMTVASFDGTPGAGGASGEAPGAGTDEAGSDAAA